MSSQPDTTPRPNSSNVRSSSQLGATGSEVFVMSMPDPYLTYWVNPARPWRITNGAPSDGAPVDAIVVFGADMTITINDIPWAQGCTYDGALRGMLDGTNFFIERTVLSDGRGRVACCMILSNTGAGKRSKKFDPTRNPTPSWTAEEGG